MKNDDEKQFQTTMELNHSLSLDSELEKLRSRLRWAQESQDLAVRILALLNRQVVGLDAIREILGMVREFTGFEAVGIRLRDGEDFPYFETQGFPAHFVEAENSLCSRTQSGEIMRDSAGKPVLECMCGNVIEGRTDPSFPFFTQGGSFWSNSTTELLATTSEEDRQARTRDRCNGEGYESVALIPLRADREIIGLLQLNDSRKNCFTLDMIGFFEGIGASIGIVLERKQSEEALEKARNELERRVEDRTAALREVNGKLDLEISERNRAEEQIKRVKEALNTVVDNLPIAVFAKSAQDGQFILWNKASESLFGFTKEQVIGKTDYDFFPREQADFFWEKDRETFASGEVVDVPEEPIQTKSLGTRILHTRKVPVYDREREPSYLLAISQDITERKQYEQALQTSEERYRTLVENIGVGISLMDSEHNVIVTNSIVGQWFNKPASEFSGKKCFQEFEKREAVCEHCPGERAMATGQPAEAETEGVRDDGTRIVVRIRAFPMLGHDGVATGFTEVIEDITERREAEEALRESEQRFRAVFENNHLVMLIVDPEAGRIVDASPGACAFYGYDREELKRKELSEINMLSPEQVHQRMQEAKFQQRRYFDFQHRLSSGEVRDVEVCTGPISIGGRTLLFSVITDVTDRKRAEQALRESEQRYRALFDESRDGVWLNARDGTLIDANEAFLDLLGLTREEVGHWNVIKAYRDPADRVRFQNTIERNGSVGDYDLKLKKKDGTEIDCQLTATLRLDEEGKVVGYQGIIRDMTERKKLEQQLLQSQKMEAIGTLAGGIAHDFNNLLTVILGYSELIVSEKNEGDRDYEDLKKVIHAGRSAADMVQQILAFSRKTETKFWPINLNKQIPQLRKMLSRLIPRTTEVQIDLDPDLPTVNADPAQIDQVLMNLAVNARDAMPNGGRLRIETKAVVLDEDYCSTHIEASKGPHALLTVSDTGTGIDRATSDRIFEPFYTTKKPGQGTGLGLAMVYGIVKSHGGHITVHSELGAGTAFRIYIPAHQVAAELDVATSGEFAALGIGTILLADDEELVRSLGERILSRTGYRILTACNGREALEIYKQKRDEITLVILDLIMPVMDGKQCLDEILKVNPQAKVLIASGYSPDGATKEILEGRAKGLVNKPYNIKQMVQSVREALDSH
jgi:PAS domain S-box-containing protein